VTIDWDELEEKALLGAPATVAGELREYEALGVDRVLIRVQFPGQSQASTLECLERFGTEVIPAL